MVQRKLGLQADLPSKSLQEPIFKKKIKKSRSMKPSDIETLKSSSSKKDDSKSKSSSKLPNYMKSTTSSDARKQEQQQQQQPQVSAQTQRNKKRHGSGSCNKETRTRTLVKTHSFKHARAPPPKERSRAALRDEIDVERATCSSTLKNSKFPGFLELSHGGTEAQGTSAMRVCPYLYCSLNGHHHDASPPLKMFLKAKRRSLKTQRSIKKTGQDMSLSVEVYVKNKGLGGEVVEISLSDGSPEPEVDCEEAIEGLAREGARMGGFCLESDCEGEDRPEAAMEEGGAISESSNIEWYEVDEEVMISDRIEDVDDLKLGFSQETENLGFQELDVLFQEELQEQEVIEDREFMASPEIECINLLKIGSSKETENLQIQEIDEGSPEIEFINHLEDGFSAESGNGELETMSKVDDVLVQEVIQEQEVIEGENQPLDDTMLVTSAMEPTQEIEGNGAFKVDAQLKDAESDSPVQKVASEVADEVAGSNPHVDGIADQNANPQEIILEDSFDSDEVVAKAASEVADEVTGSNPHADDGIADQNASPQEIILEDSLDSDEVVAKVVSEATYEVAGSNPHADSIAAQNASPQEIILEDSFDSDEVVSKVVCEVTDEVVGSNPYADGIADQIASPQAIILENSLDSDEVVSKVVSEVTDEVAGSNSHVDGIADQNADKDIESKTNSEVEGGFVPNPMKSQETILEDNLDSDGAVPKAVSEVTDTDELSKASSEQKGWFVPKPRKSPETTLDGDLNTKWRIGSRRVLEEVEEDTSFNPREPNYLPVVADKEAEKVDLKHQMMDERRSDNEWMLDYVLQQTVTKLAPARKRKVALLVEAFESVLPIPRYEPPTRAVFAHSRPIQACN